jgi:hypothetical protein
MAQINQIQRRQEPSEDEKLMQIIMTGLKVADTVYGIKDAGKKNELLAQQNTLAQEQKNRAENFQQEQFKYQKEKDAKDYGLKQQDIELKKKEVAGQDPFKRLPEDQKNVITDLSKKNAGKIAIANQIDAVMSGWDKLPDDQKVAQGRTLLKTLNSSEGADAIGSEEAKRLGSKLEFALGNLAPWNSNPIQFGRDLEGFKEQANLNSKGLKDAIAANQKIINNAYGDPNRQTAMGNAVANRSEGQLPFSLDDLLREKIRREGLGSGLKGK